MKKVQDSWLYSVEVLALDLTGILVDGASFFIVYIIVSVSLGEGHLCVMIMCKHACTNSMGRVYFVACASCDFFFATLG